MRVGLASVSSPPSSSELSSRLVSSLVTESSSPAPPEASESLTGSSSSAPPEASESLTGPSSSAPPEASDSAEKLAAETVNLPT